MKKFVNKLFVIITVLFVIVSSNGCTNQKEGKNVIKIGVILPYTGELATYGNDAKRGISIAVDEINSSGGIKGKKVKILTDDSKGESKTVVIILNKLISVNNVEFIIGAISSTVTLSMIPIIKQNKVFLFSPCAATPKLNNISVFFARNWPSNDAEASSAADYVFKKYDKSKNVIIIYVNNDWGIGLMKNFKKRYVSEGGAVKSELIYEYGNADFRTLITKLETLKPSVVYLAGNQKEMGNFIKQLREVDKILPVVANTSFLETDCLKIAGKASNGVVVSTPSYDPNDKSDSVVEHFTTVYKNKYNMLPSLTAANGYDAVFLIKKAIEVEGINPQKVGEYIRNLKNYNGASGEVSFVNGDVKIRSVYKKIVNGVPQIIK